MTKNGAWETICSTAIDCEHEVSITKDELNYFVSLNPDLVREILSLKNYIVMELAIKTAFSVRDHDQYIQIYRRSITDKVTLNESILLLSCVMLFASSDKENDFVYVENLLNEVFKEKENSVNLI